MVVIENPNAYVLKGFRPSQTKNKKIDAILQNKETGKTKVVPFGQKGSTTYQNKTGVQVDRIHSDPVKRTAYRARHKGEDRKKYSSGYFAYVYLW